MASSLRSTSRLVETDADNLCTTELRLGPPGIISGGETPAKTMKRALESTTDSVASGTGPSADDDTAAPAK
uniref:Uncharacterized protein n=1 Tax=Leersia perrieri TaxID=77586 RepID=A0A0D9WW85_9ORYZ